MSLKHCDVGSASLLSVSTSDFRESCIKPDKKLAIFIGPKHVNLNNPPKKKQNKVYISNIFSRFS